MLTKKSNPLFDKAKQLSTIKVWICALSLGLASCSSSLFFGNGVDQKVLELKSSRRINKECGNMDVSTSQFTLKSFRGLIQCLNSNKSMEPVAQLVGAISDQDLAPLVDALNTHLVGTTVSQQKRFYELEQTYQTWASHGIHKELFQKSGQILSYSDFWMSTLSILRSGFYESGTHQVNLRILKAIELLSAELETLTVEKSLKVGLTYAEAPAFVSLQTHLADHSLSDAEVHRIAQQLMEFVNQPQAEGDANQRLKFKAELIWAIQNNRLFPLLDQVLGTTQEQVVVKAPEIAKILKGLLATGSGSGAESVLMDDLSRAFRDLSRPVSCMKDSKEIKNATRYLIRELAEFRATSEARDYITREAPLTFMALGPFCQLPPQMTAHYPAMFRLAESGVLEPMVDLLKVLYQDVRSDQESASQSGATANASSEVKRPWIDLMFAMFLDPGASHLTPILKTLSDKGAFLDLIFLSNLMVDADREDVNRLLKFMVEPQDALDQQSISDVFTGALSQSSVQDVAKLILSGRSFLDLPDGFLRSSLKTMHQAYFINNVHPLLDLIKEVGGSASTQNRALFEAIFRISERHPTQLKQSIEYLSELSQGDGLVDLTDTLFQVTRKMIHQGRLAKNQAVHQGFEVAVQEQEIPHLTTQARHKLASVERENSSFRNRIEALFRQWGSSLSAFRPVPVPVVTPQPVMSDDCKRFDFSFSLDQVSNERFQAQFDAFLDCQRVSSGATAQGLSDLMSQLNQTRMGTSAHDPTFFQFQVDTIKQVFDHLQPIDVQVLVDHWMTAYDHPDRRFIRLLEALPYWVSKPILTNTENPPHTGHQSVARSLMKVTNAIVETPSSKEAFQELLNSASNLLRDRDFPKLVGALDQLFLEPRESAVPEVQASPEDEIFNDGLREEIKRWVSAKEGWRVGHGCVLSPDFLERRTQELIDEAKSNVNNKDLISVPGSPERKPRSSWTLNELKSEINPILDRFKNPRASEETRQVMDSFSRFFRRYSRPDDAAVGQVVQHQGTLALKTPNHLLKWIHERSRDYRVIPYYYPGEAHPRARLVNSLDMLELTLINVDMVMPAPPHKNLAFEFLAELADAWGDEPRANWPEEIKTKYPAPHVPPTLAQAVHHILSRKGISERLEDLETLSSYVIGLPEVDSCNHQMRGEVVLPEPNQTVIGMVGITFPLLKITPQDSFEFKRKLFNLWQVKRVLEENVSGPREGYTGGLEVLRDLFFEVYYSTPSQIRNNGYWSPSTYVRENNLNVMTASARLGAMRQIGRFMHRFHENDPLLKDVFMNVVHTGSSLHLSGLISVLLEQGVPTQVAGGGSYQLIWKLASLISRASSDDLENLKKTLSHALGAMNQIEPWAPPRENHLRLVDLLLVKGKDAVKEHYGFLSDGSEESQKLFKSLLFSPVVAEKSQSIYTRLRGSIAQNEVAPDPQRAQKDLLVQFGKKVLEETGGTPTVLYPHGRNRLSAGIQVLQALVRNENSWNSLKLLVDQLQSLTDLPEYQRLDVYSALSPALEFFEATEGQDSQTAGRLREQLASVLESRVIPILVYAQAHPNEFNQLLDLLGNSIERGDLQEFLKVVRRSLPNTEH